MAKITIENIKQKRIEIIKEVPEAGKSAREDINPHKLPLTWNVPAFFHHVLFHKLENAQAVDIDISNAGATALSILSNTALGRKYLNSGWGFFSELISAFVSNDVNQIFSTISERIKNELSENEPPFWKEWEKKPRKRAKKKIENYIGPGVIWSRDEEELYTKCCQANQRLSEIDKYLQSNDEPLRKKYVYDLIEDVFGRETLSAIVVWNAYIGLKTAQEGNRGYMAIWNASTGSNITDANRAEEAVYHTFHLIQGLFGLQISSITEHGIDDTAFLSIKNEMNKKAAQKLRYDREPIFTVIRWVLSLSLKKKTETGIWNALLEQVENSTSEEVVKEVEEMGVKEIESSDGIKIGKYYVQNYETMEGIKGKDYIMISQKDEKTGQLRIIDKDITFTKFKRHLREFRKKTYQ